MQRGEAFDSAGTLRQSDALQVKWFVHPAGHARPAWAPRDQHLSLGLLVDGDMWFDFRDARGAEQSVRLDRRGDYVLWHGPSYEHSWRTEQGCTLLTIRWPIQHALTDADHAREGIQR